MHATKLAIFVGRFTIAAATAFATLGSWKQAMGCEQSSLGTQRNFLAVAGLTLGAPQMLQSSTEGFSCNPIVWRGKTVGWVQSPVSIDGQVIGNRCQRDASGDFDPATGKFEAVYDDVEVEESALKWDAKEHKITFQPVKLPLRHFFSNPSFCKSLVAYWAIDDSNKNFQVFAVIYDLKQKQFRTKVELGTFAPFGTDYSGFLPAVSWSPDGNSVRFPAMSQGGINIKTVTLQP